VPDGAHAVTAPLTARVASIDVEVGDVVGADDVLLVLEAMKTETAIRTPAAGVVLHVACHPNQVVTAGQLLAVVAPGPAPTG
jgi:urea carboxylase